MTACRLKHCTEAGARLLYEFMPKEEARREARTLMRNVLGISEHDFFRNPDARIKRRDFHRFANLIRRRANGEPFAYLAGKREFFSVQFQVNPSVLIPRPETEELIELVLREYDHEPRRIIDMGTGSGCIAAILAMKWKNAEITASDISCDALETARCNLMELGLENRIRLIHSDLFDGINGINEYFDLIISNPPYVTREEFCDLDREVREFEPEIALVVDDPDSFYRRFFMQSYDCLKAEGRIFIESSPALLPAQRLLAEHAGFVDIRIEQDLSQKPRFLMARKN
jgi:release factor glutamine methyltransferase